VGERDRQHAFAAAADHQREPARRCRQQHGVVDVVVRTVERHAFSGEEPAHDLERLLEPGRAVVERHPERIELRPVPPGAETEHEPPAAHLVDGRGHLIPNAHVVDPAYRVPPWVTHELKKKAIEQACVDPALRAQGLARGQRPDLEESLRREASARALASAQVTTQPQLSVLLSSGVSLKAEVIKFSPPVLLDMNGRPLPDSGRDLALLRVKDAVYPAIRLSDREAKIGDPVHMLGFPGVVLSHELLNQSATLEASVTNGAVSGFKQDSIGQDIVQTDAAAAHGNSGGPLFNLDGEVIGVNTLIISPSGGSIGIGFAVPSKTVAGVVDQLRQFGELRRGWLGVRIQSVTDEIAESLNTKPARAALIAGVEDKGPAKPAGIEPGDVVVKFDGKDIKEPKDLSRFVADTAVGKDVDVVVIRKGAEETRKVKLGRLEDNDKTQQAALKKDEPAEKPVTSGPNSSISPTPSKPRTTGGSPTIIGCAIPARW